MPKLIALVRGINVGGKVLKMDKLRASFAKLGFDDVETYVQSGNVVFSAGVATASLCRKIEAQIQKDARLEVSVIVKSATEMARVIKANPFVKKKGIDLERLYVTFLSEAPAKTDIKLLDKYLTNGEELHHSGKEIYLHCPNGYGKTKINNNAIEKTLGIVATTRNWNTVNAVHVIMSSAKDL